MADLLKFPEGMEETIKYMDYAGETDEERKAYLMGFLMTAIQN